MHTERPKTVPLMVADRRQLFIDRRFIASSEGITLAVNPPAKKEIVLHGEAPWDITGCYASVVQDADRIRLYYSTHTHGDGMKKGCICYAESRDGLHFEKPRLGRVEWEGRRDHHVVMRDMLDACPFVDPLASPSERWKALYNYGTPEKAQSDRPGEWGICLATSPDGIAWARTDRRLLPFVAETHKIVTWDPDRQRYVVFLRVLDDSRPGQPRAIGRLEMVDLMQPWPHRPGRDFRCLTTSHVDAVFRADDQDPFDVDFYTSCYVRYPWAADAHFMFPSAYRHTPPPLGVDKNDGPLAAQFACSRDGIDWMRPDRTPYVRPGLDTEFDRRYTMMVVGLVRFGDKLYQYYVARGASHHGRTSDLPEGERRKIAQLAYVRLEQRLDGFMSADAAYQGGRLTTPPLVFTGNRLVLNVDTEATGSTRVEVQDEAGRALPGFAADDCDEMIVNRTDAEVRWRGNPSLSALAGRTVRLQFRLRSAKLYAFEFTGDGGSVVSLK